MKVKNLIIFALLLVFLMPSWVNAVPTATEITGCGVISETGDFYNPDGEYYFNTDLSLTGPDICWTIEQDDVEIYGNSDPTITLTGYETAFYVGDYSVTFQDFQLIGGNNFAFFLSGSSPITVENVNIESGANFYTSSFTGSLDISDSTFTNDDGFLIGILSNFSESTITGNNISTATTFLTLNDADFSSISFTNNQISASEYITISEPVVQSVISGITFENNYYTGYSETCFDANDDGYCDDTYELYDDILDDLPQSAGYMGEVTECMTLAQEGGEYYLSGDISSTSSTACIEITADDITFDGQDHTISNGASTGYGIYVLNTEGVDIENCNINGFHSNGIYVGNSLNGVYNELVLNSNMNGIFLYNSDNNELTSIEVDTSSQDGLNFNDGSDNNILEDSNIYSYINGVYVVGDNNQIYSNDLGLGTYNIYLAGSNNNISKNTITDATTAGIYLYSGEGNLIYNNDFEANVDDLIFGESWDANFNIDEEIETNINNGGSIGGNYWGDTTTEEGFSESCSNLNDDSFCDEPYEVATGVYDELPLTTGLSVYLDSCGHQLASGGLNYYLENNVTSSSEDSINGCFEISSNEILLDCNGYSIIDEADEGYGVYLSGDDSLIRNCYIEDFDTGIIVNGQGSTVYNNTLEGNDYGLYSAGEDIDIYNNYFRNSVEYALSFEVTSGILVYNNYFYETNYITQNMADYVLNTVETIGENIIGGTSIAGNYWSNPEGTGFSELCSNSNEDSFCDASYDVSEIGISDDYPLTSNTAYDIATCQELNDAGVTYNLLANVTADMDTCFSITADNITLNGNGFTLNGEYTYFDGISISTVSNVTVNDLMLSNFIDSESTPRADSSFVIEFADNVTLNNIVFEDNTGVSLVVSDGTNFGLYDATFLNNHAGIYFVGNLSDPIFSNVDISGTEDYAMQSIDDLNGMLTNLYLGDLQLINNSNGLDLDVDNLTWDITNSSLEENDFIINGDYTLNFGGVLSVTDSDVMFNGLTVENEGDLTSFEFDVDTPGYDGLEGDMNYEYLNSTCSNLIGLFSELTGEYEISGEEICPLADSDFVLEKSRVEVVISWNNISLKDYTDEPVITLVLTGENPTNTSISGYSFMKAFDFDLENQSNVEFNSSVVTINYTSDDWSEIDNFQESSLELYYFDEETSTWELVETQTLDTEENSIEANLEHFSLYGLFGTVEESSSSSSSSSSGGGGGGGGSSSSSSSSDDDEVDDTACSESWYCEAWSDCYEGEQSRICYDQNMCSTYEDEPEYTRSCTVEEDTPSTEIAEETAEDITSEEDSTVETDATETTEEPGLFNSITGAVTGVFSTENLKGLIKPAILVFSLVIVVAVAGFFQRRLKK